MPIMTKARGVDDAKERSLQVGLNILETGEIQKAMPRSYFIIILWRGWLEEFFLLQTAYCWVYSKKGTSRQIDRVQNNCSSSCMERIAVAHTVLVS